MVYYLCETDVNGVAIWKYFSDSEWGKKQPKLVQFSSATRTRYYPVSIETKEYGHLYSLLDADDNVIPGTRRLVFDDGGGGKVCCLEWRGTDYALWIKGYEPFVIVGNDPLVVYQSGREIAKINSASAVEIEDAQGPVTAVKRLEIEPVFMPVMEIIASVVTLRFAPCQELLWRGGALPSAVARTGLLYTPLTKKAMKLCFEAHKDQVDKSGLPYVFHPFHLAEQMPDEVTTVTALLHDVVEDTDYTLDDLRAMGFPSQVVEALALLTHDKAVPYLDYVDTIKFNPIARAVKLADLRHNSDTTRLDMVDNKARERLAQYAQAIARLESSSETGRSFPFEGLYDECFGRSEHQELIKLSNLPFQEGYYVTEYDLVFMVRGASPYALRPYGWRRDNRLNELWYDSMTNFADIPPDIVAQLGLEAYPVLPDKGVDPTQQ